MRIALPTVLLCGLLTSGCFERSTVTDSLIVNPDTQGSPQTPSPTSPPVPAHGFATVKWTATPGEQTGFYVEGSTDNVSFKTMATVPDGTTTATITGLVDGTTYYFRIRGYNATGTSQPTAVLTANVP